MEINLKGVVVTCLGLVLLVLEAGSSSDTAESFNVFGQNAQTRQKRDGESQGAKTSLVPNAVDSVANVENSEASKVTNVKPESKVNCSLPAFVNNTQCKDDGYVDSLLKQMSDNKGMLWRTLCVSLGVTGIVIVYFTVRAVRLRRKRSKSRKYGIITQHDHGDVEMEPLGDGNDDDDDYTVFEMNGRR